METTFKKVHTAKDLTISISIILVGIGLCFVNMGLGVSVAICGLLTLCLYKSGYKKDGVVLARKSEDLCKACKASLLEFLKGQENTPMLTKGSEGGCIRLDVYFNQKEGVAYAQVFDFCYYTYEPASELVRIDYDKSDKLINQLSM